MRKMKMIMSAGLLAMSLFSGLTFHTENVMASEVVNCEMNNVEGKRGETVNVTIKVTSNPGTIMSETKFAYDSNVVEVTNVTELGIFITPETEGITSDYVKPNFAKNPLQLINGYQAFEGNTNNIGELYTIELKIKDDAAFGKSDITFTGEFLDWEFNEYEVNCASATINVTCAHGDVKEVADKAPTCTEKGSNNKVCNICGETVGTVDVDAKGHSYGDWAESKAPTCTEKGQATRVCSVCNNTETKDVDAVGHKLGDWAESKAPTCTEKGTEKRVCSACDYSETRDVDAVGHKLGDWVTDKAATCTEAGTEKRVCSACDYFESRDVAALGHKVEEWVVTKEPTYTEEGLKEGKCTLCSETLTEVVKKINAAEIVVADDVFAKYEIADDTKVMDKDGKELAENKLQLKAVEITDNESIKKEIGLLAKEGMELKGLTAYQVKLLTNTDGIEVGKLDKAVTVTMKVSTDYTAAGEVFVLNTDGVWVKSDVEMKEGTITFEMTETKAFAFANFEEAKKSDDVTNDKEDNKTDNKTDNSDNKEDNKTNSTNKEPVKTGDTTTVVSIILLMAIAAVAVVVAKKRETN